MRRLESSPPVPVFAVIAGREASVAAVVLVEPSTSTRPGDLEWLLEQVVERMEHALTGAFEGLPAELEVFGVTNPEHTPFFPIALGGRRYESISSVEESMENLRGGTPLDELAYDAAGRAFACDIHVTFRRVANEDQRISSVWNLEAQPESIP